MKTRLDIAMVERRLVASRSQAESYIKLGYVRVGGSHVTKPGALVSEGDTIRLMLEEQYVSRAALKLASAVHRLAIAFSGKVVLDVGSSTGGFTDYALRRGACKVIAVEAGADQLHKSLRNDSRIELYEKTDIRTIDSLIPLPDIILMDLSFVSLRDILPHIVTLAGGHTQVLALVKPQFEAGDIAKHKGVIKNDTIRRDIFRGFEKWVQNLFIIIDKTDSEVHGAKGNRERFYLLHPLKKTAG